MEHSVFKFLNGPLVAWLSSCLEETLGLSVSKHLTYDRIIDGVLIHDVFLEMNINVVNDQIWPSNYDAAQRSRNLNAILDNLREYYENHLRYVILRLPDVSSLAEAPDSHVMEAELLLYMLLSCAVQCPNKEYFIKRITRLQDKVQQKLTADCITWVISEPNIILSPDMLSSCSESRESNSANISLIFEQVYQIYQERNDYKYKLEKQLDLRDKLFEDQSHSIDRDYLLAEWKSKTREQAQKLVEKMNELDNCKEELRKLSLKLNKLEIQNVNLEMESKRIENLRDKLDEANEKIDNLQQEIADKDKKQISFNNYKNRMDKKIQALENLLEQSEKSTTLSNKIVQQLKIKNTLLCKADKHANGIMHSSKLIIDQLTTRNDQLQKLVDQLRAKTNSSLTIQKSNKIYTASPRPTTV